MIERSDGVSFLLETRRVLALQSLDGDDAVEARVARLVDLSHAPGPDGRKDLIRAEFVAWLERHTSDLLSVRGREGVSARMTAHPVVTFQIRRLASS